MSIFNRVVIGLILVALFPLVYLAANALSLYHNYRRENAKSEQRLESMTTEAEHVLYGDNEAVLAAGQGMKGIHRLEAELYALVSRRGRVWEHCTPSPNANTAQSGSATVAIPAPTPHGLVVGTSVFVFEERPI